MAAHGSCRNARGLQWEAELTDIAEGGCRIADPARRLTTGEQLRLMIAGTGPHHARVCWQRGGAAGLAFARPLTGDLLAALQFQHRHLPARSAAIHYGQAAQPAPAASSESAEPVSPAPPIRPVC